MKIRITKACEVEIMVGSDSEGEPIFDVQEFKVGEICMKNVVKSGLWLGGIRGQYRFGNGFGASVVRNPHSYGGDSGLWELAVLRYTGPSDDDFQVCYDTPITDDVLGWLSEDDLKRTLKQISKLPVFPAPAKRKLLTSR